MAEIPLPPPCPTLRAEWSMTTDSGPVQISTPNPRLMSPDDYDDAIWLLNTAVKMLTRRKAEAERSLHGEQPVKPKDGE